MTKPILVIGSLNMDLVISVPHQPTPGETVLGTHTNLYPGGKGANQAVAAARAGGTVSMVGRIGRDDFGRHVKKNLKDNRVNGQQIQVSSDPTGIALITVDPQGQNMIVVSPGANGTLIPKHLRRDRIHSASLVLLQLEIPMETVEWVARVAAEAGIPVLLNPAPIQPLSPELLECVHYLILNETEASQLTGTPVSNREEAKAIARELQQLVPTVIVTLGRSGVVWSSAEGEGYRPAYAVEVVDTTAAGDSFCGALAVQIAQTQLLPEAIRFATAAAALTVTRAGAQPSLPTRTEIERFLSL